jgi:hypothetical protein
MHGLKLFLLNSSKVFRLSPREASNNINSEVGNNKEIKVG